MREDNLKVFTAFYDAMNRHDTGRMRELLSADLTDHEAPAGTPQGAEGVIMWAEQMWTAMPDLHMHVGDVTVAEDDRVAGLVTVTGTNTGELWGMPPTGRAVDYDTIDIVRFADGRAVEHWGVSDTARLMTQLGLAPADGVIETVTAIYDAFGRQDIPTILDLLADDIRWEEGMIDFEVPWLRPGRGRAAAEAFFAALGQHLDITGFELRNMLASGDQVAAVIDIRATERTSGRDLSDPCEIHLWTIEDGRATAFRHHLDTHRHVLASV